MTATLPNTSDNVLVSWAAPNVLLVTINRPHKLNAVDPATNKELDNVFTWAEQEDNVWCSIITGAGDRAFCAGFDLVKGHESRSQNGETDFTSEPLGINGFAGLSNRNQGRKPLIAAVNGYAVGGGSEIMTASDIVVATEKSKFGFPEVKRGMIVAAGGLGRIVRSLPYQVASELLLTGRLITANEAKSYGIVNKVIPDHVNVVDAALEYAQMIVSNSPDAVMMTKKGILLALERESLTKAHEDLMDSDEAAAWKSGKNMTIGLKAFAEKQTPRYENPEPIVRKSKL
ncbi:ClpP/crotonase [Hesseltinella vesiculosa]|uniref:ClpP/crotonase n=1 Tax=Hesseltinella vesiculosa TaxID=101127 RepID=A0A1X2GJ44_9FUNG|nr:ClpP/crotonase [Hesseltinella vesiculosa]